MDISYSKPQDRYAYRCLDKERSYKLDTHHKGDLDRSKGCKMNKSLELVATENHLWDVLCKVVKYSSLERAFQEKDFREE